MSGELTVRTGRIKHARRLATRAFRAKTGEFLAEGPQAVREALGVPGAVIEVFATAEASGRHADLVRSAGDRWTVVSDEVVAEVADAVNPQGVVAHCRDVTVGLATLLASKPRYVVVCADIRDPGNVGAVIRCADAAGADGVIIAGDSVDPLNPKAVRATAGSLFHVPVAIDRDVAGTINALRRNGLQVLAADGAGDVELFDPGLDLTVPTAWLMGNEAWGLPPEVAGLADRVVAVPIYGRAESLNLATAAAVCLYAGAHAIHG